MKLERDTLVFETTGRRLYCFGTVIGLSPSGHVTGGFDDTLEAEGDIDDPDADYLTLEERRELAAYMVARWKAWGEAAVMEMTRTPKEVPPR